MAQKRELLKGGLLASALILILIGLTSLPVSAQGAPASVTSQGFGGNFSRSPGVPASVTSRGTIAAPRPPVFPQPRCCINPLFPVSRNPINNGHLNDGRRHHHSGFVGGYAPGVVYYAGPYDNYDSSADDAAAQQQAQQQAMEEQDYRGGPTVFDRRGPGGPVVDANAYDSRPAPDPSPSQQVDAAPPRPVADQPQTVLIFKDGHRLEVSNYAIVGSTLFDLTPGHRRKVAISELDLSATTKENDERGVDFRLPPGTQGS